MTTASVPTQHQMQQTIRRLAPKLGVYMAGDDWKRVVYGNIEYWIPPDLGSGKTAEHPVLKHPNGHDPLEVVANGELLIGTRYGILRNHRGVETGTGPMPGENAEEIVLFLVEKHGAEGLIYLTGDPAVDGPAKELARKSARKAKKEWAESERNARVKFVQDFEKKNPGRTPPPPKATQIAAQEYLDELADSERTGAEHLCKFNDYETSDFTKFQRHMRVAHGMLVEPPTPAELGEKVDDKELRATVAKRGGAAAGERIRQSAAHDGTPPAPPAASLDPAGAGTGAGIGDAPPNVPSTTAPPAADAMTAAQRRKAEKAEKAKEAKE